MQSKNYELLRSFVEFCSVNPELRFWQALRAWAEVIFVLVAEYNFDGEVRNVRDTFYWEGKNK